MSLKATQKRLFLFVGVIVSLFGLVTPFLNVAQSADSEDEVPGRRVNAPYLSNPSAEQAILWFGEVNPTDNYVDVRLSYDNEAVQITLHIIDRKLWYDTLPEQHDLDSWDATSLYLHLGDETASNTPTPASHRFVAQLNHWQERTDFQAAYRGNGTEWMMTSTPFATETLWRGDGLNGAAARGWSVTYLIPFSSLDLDEPPPNGTIWRLALVVHDRDDANGTPIPTTSWPESAQQSQPETWGELHFGMPSYPPLVTTSQETFTVRHGLDNVIVEDAHVGGHTDCGDAYNPDFFDGWGNANYAGYDQINVQNQWDLADWPCFSKFFVTFPLDALPVGKAVIRATLTMHQFGNSEPSEAPPSYVQVLALNENWNEQTLTWNNAPLPIENFGGTWVDSTPDFPGWPGIPVQWDVTRALADAYNASEPLRLVLYSADKPRHTGKYFSSSNTDDWNAVARPTLQVVLGEDPRPVTSWTFLPLVSGR